MSEPDASYDESYVREIIEAAKGAEMLTARQFAHLTVLDVQAGYSAEVREAWRRYSSRQEIVRLCDKRIDELEKSK
jgi:hypothetical protein